MVENTLPVSYTHLDVYKRQEVYHIGASLKDLGKKLFAFTKMNMPASVIMNSLEL